MPITRAEATHPRREVSASLRPLAVAGAVLLVAFHAWATLALPLERLLTLVPDDAFYYAGIARHLALDGRPTFDGVNPTNGFHPGWMALLTLAARAGLDAPGVVRFAIGLGYAFHVGTAALLFALLRRGRETLAAPGMGAALWLLNPFPLLLAQQAVEASLLCFAVALFFCVHLEALERVAAGHVPSRVYAVSAALLVWARTDAGLLAVLGGLQLLSQAGRRNRPAWRWLLRTAILGAALVAPWLAFSWWTVGTIVQDSAAMKQLWRAAGATIGEDPVGWRVLTGAWFGVPAMWMSGALYFGAALSVAKLLIVGGTLLGFLRLPRDGPWRRIVVLVVGWSLMAGAAYAWTITDLQVWHFAVPALALFLASWIGWARLGRLAPDRWRLPVTAVASLALLAASTLVMMSWRRPPVLYPWQPDTYRSAIQFESRLPADAVIGSFGAGIAGTLAPRRVINLDGLVNHAVVPYWRDRRWSEYVRAAGITHIADDRANLERALAFSARPLSLTPLAQAPLTGWHSGPRVLWRVER